MAAEINNRKAPYAPITSLRDFFERMRDMSTPQRVDRRFIQKMNVASNNEWALLSALKFLGVVDERGVPTHSYRLLQTTDRFQETLAHLVRNAYSDLFDSGVHVRGTDELRDYFRLTSSPSQARNAARFFREVCTLAGIESTGESLRPVARSDSENRSSHRIISDAPAAQARSGADDSAGLDLLAARVRLLEKLPPFQPDWSAAEYAGICQSFLRMLELLGT
jgi:hypothetical protein